MDILRPIKPERYKTGTEILITDIVTSPTTYEYLYKGTILTMREIILPSIPGGFLIKIIWDYLIV